MSECLDLARNISCEWESLLEVWTALRGEWRDSVADQVQKNYIDEWQGPIDALLRAVGDFADISDSAIRGTRHSR